MFRRSLSTTKGKEKDPRGLRPPVSSSISKGMAAAAAWCSLWRRPASLSSDLRRLPQISGGLAPFSASGGLAPSFSPSRKLPGRKWTLPDLWQVAWKVRFFNTLCHDAARSGSSRDRISNPRWHQPAMKRYLYLVVNDQEFSIHKLDMDDHQQDTVDSGSPRHLPEPPLIRLGAPIIPPWVKFSALGSNIVAICASPGDPNSRVTLVFDTKTAFLTVARLLPRGLASGCDVAIAVRNKLYIFDSHPDTSLRPESSGCHNTRGGLYCLAVDVNGEEGKQWGPWRPLCASSRFCWSWTNSPPGLPFDASSIIAHTVHPRGGTIFVSEATPLVEQGTFSYSTRSGKWTCHGDWLLPFKGPAFYDEHMNAWIGLHRHSDDSTDGYLCACQVTSAAQASIQAPEWIVGGEKLFLDDPEWSHVNAKLIYMSDSQYCLVEQLLPRPKGTECMLRLTTFGVKYGDHGELITISHQPARLYEVPNYDQDFDIQAFWI